MEKYRYLTTAQIKGLLFATASVQACRLRLLKLYQNGYLNRLRQEVVIGTGSAETVYCLDRKGVELLATQRDEEPESAKYQPHFARVKGVFIKHTLAIVEFRLTVEKEIEQRGDLRIHRWFNEWDIADPLAIKKRDKFFIYDEVMDTTNNQRLSVYPDAVFVLEREKAGEKSRELYFVEIDMGTMTHRRIREKLRAYEIYRRAKRHKVRYGKEYEDFTVLMQTTSGERAENLQVILNNGSEIEIFHANRQLDIYSKK